MKDTTHTITRSATRFFSGTLLSRISGMARDVAMAAVFGTHAAVSAFLVAFRLAHLLRRLFGEGAMQSAFVPQFEALRTEDPKRAVAFFRSLTFVLALALISFIVLAMGALGGLLLFGDFTEQNRDILFLALLLMPSLLFICLFGLNMSLLQCEKSYFTPGVAPVAFNMIWVAGVLFLWKTPAAAAMPWLALWVILACFCQWLITVPRVLGVLKLYGQSDMPHTLFQISSDLKKWVRPFFFALTGVAATQVNNALDAIFARYADLEGPSYLWFALRLQQLPLALFGIAIAGALLPPLTRAIKSADCETFHRFLEFATCRSIALMLPITIALFVMGDSCVNLLYGHGSFTDLSTMSTTKCLWCYSVGLVPMTLVLVFAPAFYAQGIPRIPAKASLIAVGANILLNTWLIVGMGKGAASIALATSVSAVLNMLFLIRSLEGFSAEVRRNTFVSGAKILFTSLVAGAVVIGCDLLFLGESSALQIAQGIVPPFSRDFSLQLLHVATQSLCFLFTLLATAWMVDAKDLLHWLPKN
jgi:putative peptidoglycan lipid II flippase